MLFMVLLGFIDDVFDIKWRYKLVLPFFASLPLCIAYYLSGGTTSILVPVFLRSYLNGTVIVNIGWLYYVYISMLTIFNTNAINIYAGINGLEVG